MTNTDAFGYSSVVAFGRRNEGFIAAVSSLGIVNETIAIKILRNNSVIGSCMNPQGPPTIQT
jgi:hypothetical protein